MDSNNILISLFLIFTGAAILSTIALYTRQSLLVAYMLVGILLGPWGLKIVSNSQAIQNIGDVGIIFLLFLLGLHLQPQNMLYMLKKLTWIAIISSLVFAIIGFSVAWLFHYSITECLIIGAAMMFSSTIIGLKLLPTTVLHHQHTGELMIGVLLMQDLIAIIVLLLLHGATFGDLTLIKLSMVALSLPGLLIFAFMFERWILIKLVARYDRIREYMFLLSIAWCLGLGELAQLIGLSREVGAFIAGVTIASSPISLYIAENLKPLRDFFLVLFFFSVGASFNMHYFKEVAFPALLLAAVLLVIKPLVFQVLMQYAKETKPVAREVGVRLGQVSEFSLLIAFMALQGALIDSAASNLIQATTMLTFIASSYIVVLCYPTPVAISDKLRRD